MFRKGNSTITVFAYGNLMTNNILENEILNNYQNKSDNSGQRIALTKVEEFSCARKNIVIFSIFHTFVYKFFYELIYSLQVHSTWPQCFQ